MKTPITQSTQTNTETFPPQRNSRWIDLLVIAVVLIVLLGGIGNAFSEAGVLATPAPTLAPNAEACPAGGCVKPPEDLCAGRPLKALVTADGQRLYYSADHPAYFDILAIHVERGDRWFCTAAGAEASGFTPAPLR